MIEIETAGDVVRELAEDPLTGRVQSQQEAGGEAAAADPWGRPVHKSGERGVVVVKRERIRGPEGTAGNVNYVILSKTPSDPADPIYKINKRVRRVTVVGGVAGVTAASLGLLGEE